MEFKFRAGDDRPSSYHSPFSSVNYYSHTAFRGGFSAIDNRGGYEVMQNPNCVREAIWREIEKERIREEIMAEEFARRRFLEAEVRRELMMENEMTLRHFGFSFDERLPLPFDSRYPSMNRFDNRLPYSDHSSPRLVLLPDSMEPEIKPISEAEPNPNHSGLKRKAIMPSTPNASELQSIILDSNKKPKEEWSCALCQVSATSEKDLNAHLQGKKHKAKEEGLRAQRPTLNACTALQPTKDGNPKLTETDKAQRNGTETVQKKKKKSKLQRKVRGKRTGRRC